MAFINNPFSLPDLFQHRRTASISPLRFPSPLHAKLFTIMTCDEHVFFFNTELNRIELLREISIVLTSDSDYFLAIITNKLGSKHMLKLLGKTNDMDALFFDAIRRSFLQIMTDQYASHVAVRAMTVFNKEKKTTMYEHIFFNALEISCDQHGCFALIDIMIDMDEDEDYKYYIFDFVTHNDLILSKHESGHYIVQHVLELDYLQYTFNIVYNLSGHFVKLSFNKYGSFVVGKILEADDTCMVVVGWELLKCEEDTFIRLATNEFGNEVVCRAIKSREAKA